MASLYQLNEAFQAALTLYESGCEELVDTETGEIIPIEDYLSQLELDREEKIDNTILYMKSLKAEEAAIKAEEDALKKRREAKKATRERLQSYIMLNIGDVKKRETAQYCLKVRTSTSVDAPIDEATLKAMPADLVTHKETWAPNKTAIGKLLKAGENIPGCSLVENKSISY